ncbi:conjugal transfer protein TraH [Burkholderia vietnamiensis]|uniref:conjugal transfer protein TraH n=1 Tax=Burkholderia vietnamiensis TaxID=60552 RepID=UPI001593E273|nr:conjugal transfer protein TraH [Burkholderia vietnamiensis]MCA8270367.1 hypothetical protein [Burkholderia vietnamiensis]
MSDTTQQNLMGQEVPPYVSPTLQRLPVEKRPNPSTVCEGCPASLWYVTSDGLANFCRAMRVLTWSKEEPKALTDCDGEVLAQIERIEKIKEAQRRQAESGR